MIQTNYTYTELINYLISATEPSYVDTGYYGIYLDVDVGDLDISECDVVEYITNIVACILDMYSDLGMSAEVIKRLWDVLAKKGWCQQNPYEHYDYEITHEEIHHFNNDLINYYSTDLSYWENEIGRHIYTNNNTTLIGSEPYITYDDNPYPIDNIEALMSYLSNQRSYELSEFPVHTLGKMIEAASIHFREVSTIEYEILYTHKSNHIIFIESEWQFDYHGNPAFEYYEDLKYRESVDGHRSVEVGDDFSKPHLHIIIYIDGSAAYAEQLNLYVPITLLKKIDIPNWTDLFESIDFIKLLNEESASCAFISHKLKTNISIVDTCELQTIPNQEKIPC